MKKDEMNYEKDLIIDPDILDKEWIRQPRLYMDYAELLADARQKRSQADQTLKVLGAELISEAKRRIAKPTGKPPTVQEIDAYVNEQQPYKKAQDLLIKEAYQVDILTSAIIAFDHRKKALENLVQLWRGGYYSSPQEEPSEGKDIRERAAEVEQGKQKSNLGRRRTK